MKFICTLLMALLASCGGGGGAPAAPAVVAFYGDSITTGTHGDRQVWSPTPVEHIAKLAHITPISYAYDGASSADAHIVADGSELVVIRFGVADAFYAMRPDAFAMNVTRLVSEAQAAGKRVLLVGVPFTSTIDTGPLDAVMRERAHALGVNFVDVELLGPGSFVDALHPDEVYSRRIGELLAAAIVREVHGA